MSGLHILVPAWPIGDTGYPCPEQTRPQRPEPTRLLTTRFVRILIWNRRGFPSLARRSSRSHFPAPDRKLIALRGASSCLVSPALFPTRDADFPGCRKPFAIFRNCQGQGIHTPWPHESGKVAMQDDSSRTIVTSRRITVLQVCMHL